MAAISAPVSYFPPSYAATPYTYDTYGVGTAAPVYAPSVMQREYAPITTQITSPAPIQAPFAYPSNTYPTYQSYATTYSAPVVQQPTLAASERYSQMAFRPLQQGVEVAPLPISLQPLSDEDFLNRGLNSKLDRMTNKGKKLVVQDRRRQRTAKPRTQPQPQPKPKAVELQTFAQQQQQTGALLPPPGYGYPYAMPSTSYAPMAYPPPPQVGYSMPIYGVPQTYGAPIPVGVAPAYTQ